MQYCDQIEQLKEELAIDNLLVEENLIKRLDEVEEAEVSHLKNMLTLKLISITDLPSTSEEYANELVLDTRNLLQLCNLTRKRCQQLMKLKQWEEHINQVNKSKKLVVENNADLAGPPKNFTYINQSIPGAGAVIPDEPPIGCDCVAYNCRSKSCCGM